MPKKAALVITFTLGGCELMGPQLAEKIPLDLAPLPPEEAPKPIAVKTPASVPAITAPEIYPAEKPLIRKLAPKVAPKRPSGKYTLNFDGANIADVIKVVFEEILKENYVLSPRVGGTITMHTVRPLHRDEVLPVLEAVLKMNGLRIVRRPEGFYWIGPEVEARRGAPIGTKDTRLAPGFQIRIFPLKFINVQSAAKLLKPLLSPQGILHVDPLRNLIIAAGTPQELEAVEEVVSAFDVNLLKGVSMGLFPLTHVDAKTIVEDLHQLFPLEKLAQEIAPLHFFPIERLNAVMVVTTQAEYLKEAEAWIKRLDRALEEEAGGVYVYRVQNMDAEALANLLNEIFTGRGGRKKAAPVQPGVKVGRRNGISQTMRTASQERNLRIIADKVNNALIILADKQTYQAVKRVIHQLDVMPLQVLINAQILEVSLSDDLKYGVQWFFSKRGGKTTGEAIDSATKPGGMGAILTQANQAALATFFPGLNYIFTADSGKVQVVIDALARDGRLTVLSAPSLMVLNNEEAEIKVGDQVPIITSQATSTGTAANAPVITQNIQMRDTGVILKIKPRVNASGMVIMELEQRVDDIAGQTGVAGNPIITQRVIKSSAAVGDGETLVLGGLIKDNRSRNREGVPVLSKIPILGNLFSSTNRRFRRTELIVLITPRVVKRPRDVRVITNEYKLRLREIYEIRTPRKTEKTQSEINPSLPPAS